jgi:uncharacterized caspase-like protein
MKTRTDPGVTRRRFIKAGLATSLFLPLPYAQLWAQSEGALKLVRLPKVALVLGNADYAKVPALANPVNDARGIGQALETMGFAVTTKLDATRAGMLQAIDAYSKALAARPSVGLFYFAGHGMQLAWRNYLLPVDADVRKVEDISAYGIDVGAVMEGIKRARNPMNVVILDACRDNPFAAVKADARGLSQMDAPGGTLLAYATSPGNTASDGSGANGLYTENLLREMKVADAKIEDVFKRVRLAVRRRSNGQQIPWESTSLEEDFYFIPPAQLKKLSEEEEKRLFAEEQALYEQAKSAREPAPVEEYLRRYPSGRFAELAQHRLDRLLAAQGEKPVEIVSAAGNPNTAGTARADTRFKVGDRYEYRVTDRISGGAGVHKRTLVVAQITEDEVIFNNGRPIVDLLGNTVLTGDGRRFTPRQDQPLEFAVGKRWTTRFGVARGEEQVGVATMSFKIVAREMITVPAGKFDCYRIEGRGYNVGTGRGSELSYTYWTDPDQVRRPIAMEEFRRGMPASGPTRIDVDERIELVSYRQG